MFIIIGKIIYADSGITEEFSVDLSTQSTGIYLVRIVSKDAEVTKKIIKQ